MIAQRLGKIVNIGGSSLHGRALRMAYSATMSLRGIAKGVTLEAGPYNVNVDDVFYSIVEGPRFQQSLRIKAESIAAIDGAFKSATELLRAQRLSTHRCRQRGHVMQQEIPTGHQTGHSVDTHRQHCGPVPPKEESA